jgi:cell division septum initiation protein DivIVA
MAMSTKAELAAQVESLRERLRAAGEMHRSAVASFARAIAERDQRLQALQAKRPMMLKAAAKEAGVPYTTAWEWAVRGLLAPLINDLYDANELRRLAAAKGYPRKTTARLVLVVRPPPTTALPSSTR